MSASVPSSVAPGGSGSAPPSSGGGEGPGCSSPRNPRDVSALWASLVRPGSFCPFCQDETDCAHLVIGPCGHTACTPCLYSALLRSLTDFGSGGGVPASAYVLPSHNMVSPPGIKCDVCLGTDAEFAAWSREYWDSVRSRTPRPVPPEAAPVAAATALPAGLVYTAVFSALKEWSIGGVAARRALGPVPSGADLRQLHPSHLRLAEEAADLAVLSQPPPPVESIAAAMMRAPSQVAPAMCSCGALIAVDAFAKLDGGDAQGVHATCLECGTGLCAACGLVWDVSGVSHTGQPCENIRAQRADNEDRLKELSPDAKVCPNPDCRRPAFHKFGHKCHSTSCVCGWTFCYVCLLTPSEQGQHHKCGGTCNDLCGCAPCIDCIFRPEYPASRSRNCDECTGQHAGDGCITCRLGNRPETDAETAEREARHARAVAEKKAEFPEWTGPRRFRPLSDCPPMGPNKAAASPWNMRATLTGTVGGAAARAREGLQLLVHAANQVWPVNALGAAILNVTVMDAQNRKTSYNPSDLVVVRKPDGSDVLEGEGSGLILESPRPLKLRVGMRVRRGPTWHW